jgi:TolB-like protein
MTHSTGAVFLSYASDDAAAAQQICEALRAAGIEVWFDQSELRGGDAWDRKIKQQIHDCALFIAVISARSNARSEGYFRREWRLAVDRTHDLADDLPFLLPVVIDQTSETNARVPDQFREVQWTRVPEGGSPNALIERVQRLLAPEEAEASPPKRRAADKGVITVHIPKTVASGPAVSWRLVVVLLLIAAAVITTGYFVIDRVVFARRVMVVDNPARAPAAAAAPEKSIAVLPFVDMSEKHDQEYFSDGLSEELIDLLTKIPALRVPARTSSFYFKGKADDITTIAFRLHVAHVLEGSVRKSGNQLRVTAQLVRADDGYHVWSETYDRKWDDVFKVQDEIAAAVVKALEVSLLGKPMPKSIEASNSAAYALYLRGREATRRSDSKEEDDQAIGILEQAAKLDPGYAPTWALLARMHVSTYEDYKVESREKIRAAAFREAQQAIKLDPDWAEAHVALSRVYMMLDWNWAGADQEMQTALALDSTNPDVLRNAHYLARTLGRFDECLREIQAATDRDPLFYYNYEFLAGGQVLTGHMEKAVASIQKARQLIGEPEAFSAYASMALLALGQPAAALHELEAELARPSGSPLRYLPVFVPAALDALGRTTEAARARADAESKFGKTDPYEVGFMYAAGNDLERAFAWWDRAVAQHDIGLTYLKTAPEFALKPQLASDPRFKALLRKMKLPET